MFGLRKHAEPTFRFDLLPALQANSDLGCEKVQASSSSKDEELSEKPSLGKQLVLQDVSNGARFWMWLEP